MNHNIKYKFSKQQTWFDESLHEIMENALA